MVGTDGNIFQLDMSFIDYLILNEAEAAQLPGYENSDNRKLIDDLRVRYPHLKIVLTLGEEGSVYIDRKCIIKQDIYFADTVDTTAAGDTFTGYFIAGIIEGEDVKNALDHAAKAASITVSRKGAAPSIPYRKEVYESILK